MRLRLPWFTLYGTPRGARVQCLREMLLHEWVEQRWGTIIAHARPRSIRYAIGAPAPAAPTGFAATPGVQTLADDGGDCTVTSLNRIDLTWNPTGLGGQFLWYQIQRLEDAGWVDIAFPITESIGNFEDYETARGVVQSYRMRVVNQSEEPSAWTATVTATAEPGYCEWLFVTNVDPSLNLGYQVRPGKEYVFPDGSDVVLKKLWGRDYQVAFQPTERRGVMLALDLTVTFGPTVDPGVAAFDAIRALSVDGRLPYVCVLDPHGNRIFAKLQVPRGLESQPGGRYHATPQITEVAATPYAPQITLSHNYNAPINYNFPINYNG